MSREGPLATEASDSDVSEEGSAPRCSFCNKSHLEVRRLIAGPAVHICDECVAVCADLLRGDEPTADILSRVQGDEPPAWDGGAATVRCALCGLPWRAAEALLVPDKGALCRVCVDEVDALTAAALWGKLP